MVVLEGRDELGRRDANDGAHASGISPRRVLGLPPDGDRVAVLPHSAPRRARPALGAASRVGRAPARRPAGRDTPAIRSPIPRGRSARTRARTSASSLPCSAIRTGCSRTSSRPLRLPRHPMRMLRFGLAGLRSATGFARGRFRGDRARALFAGCAAHSVLPLERSLTAALGLVFCLIGHVEEWPVAEGGSASIARALASLLVSLGGRIETGRLRPHARRSAARARGPLRHQPRAARRDRRAGPARGVRAAAAPVPLRARRLQDRLGARRADPVDRSGRPRSVDGAPGRDARRDRCRRGGRLARRAPRATLRHAHPAEPVRPDARARRQAHRVRLLPRARGIDGRPDGDDRAPGRALRARLSRSHPRATRHEHGRSRALQPVARRAAPSPAASQTSASSSRGPSRAGTLTRRPTPASSSARRPRLRAAAFTGCRGTTPPARR